MPPACQVFGYHAGEQDRIRHSHQAIQSFNEQAFGLVFGFNARETERLTEARQYDIAPRIGIYPLDVWGWDRQRCLDYIKQVLGITWVRSRCCFCPFNRLTADDIERHRQHPEELAEALLIEFIALAMNPRATLYPKRSLYKVATAHQLHRGLQLFDDHLAHCEWGYYRVRRLYHMKAGDPHQKGLTDRAVERLATGTRAAMMREFTANTGGLTVERHHHHLYA